MTKIISHIAMYRDMNAKREEYPDNRDYNDRCNQLIEEITQEMMLFLCNEGNRIVIEFSDSKKNTLVIRNISGYFDNKFVVFYSGDSELRSVDDLKSFDICDPSINNIKFIVGKAQAQAQAQSNKQGRKLLEKRIEKEVLAVEGLFQEPKPVKSAIPDNGCRCDDCVRERERLGLKKALRNAENGYPSYYTRLSFFITGLARINNNIGSIYNGLREIAKKRYLKPQIINE